MGVATSSSIQFGALPRSGCEWSPQATVDPILCLRPLDAGSLEKVDRPCLEKFSYAPGDAVQWQVRPGRKGSGPELCATVKKHREVDGHTLCIVKCSLACNWFRVTWEAPRRLKHLRQSLHDPLKQTMGPHIYARHFAGAPFACRGGLPGTTARLSAWFGALAHCMNTGGCSPADVSFVLQFLDTPEPSSVGEAVVCIPHEKDRSIEPVRRRMFSC